MNFVSRGLLACAVSAGLVSGAAAFDWEKLIPPPTGSSGADESSATGSAAARGIDEGGAVASRGRNLGAVEAVEAAEPDEAHVAKFVEKGGLSLGTAPTPRRRAVAADTGSARDVGMNLLQAFDPTGYAGAAAQTAKGVIGIGTDEEIELGRRLAASILAQYGRSHDRDAETYVNLVAAVVGRNSARPELHYHVAVLNTPEVNAFSAPGGYLFVTRGAVSLIEDEAELGGVIAHEVAHVTEKHILKEIRRANVLGGAMSAARSAGFTAGQYSELVDFSKNLLSRGLDRKDELAADAVGASFAARAGYGSRGLERFLERLRDRERSRSGSALFRTHPPAEARIAALEASGAIGASVDRRLADRFHRFVR